MTVAPTLEAKGQVTGPRTSAYPYTTIPYPDAYAYVLALLTGQARLRETKAVASTGILEAHKHGRVDSIVVFPAGSLTRGEAEVWMRQIGTAA